MGFKGFIQRLILSGTTNYEILLCYVNRFYLQPIKCSLYIFVLNLFYKLFLFSDFTCFCELAPQSKLTWHDFFVFKFILNHFSLSLRYNMILLTILTAAVSSLLKELAHAIYIILRKYDFFFNHKNYPFLTVKFKFFWLTKQPGYSSG